MEIWGGSIAFWAEDKKESLERLIKGSLGLQTEASPLYPLGRVCYKQARIEEEVGVWICIPNTPLLPWAGESGQWTTVGTNLTA